tara:strand:- start:6 stop:197 length:192 start_codon:yes stop_codon:yes gene_type:complete
MIESRTIDIGNGVKLELDCTEKLFDAVRHYFSLKPSIAVTDNHLKEFVIKMCQNAVDKAEDSM